MINLDACGDLFSVVSWHATSHVASKQTSVSQLGSALLKNNIVLNMSRPPQIWLCFVLITVPNGGLCNCSLPNSLCGWRHFSADFKIFGYFMYLKWKNKKATVKAVSGNILHSGKNKSHKVCRGDRLNNLFIIILPKTQASKYVDCEFSFLFSI